MLKSAVTFLAVTMGGIALFSSGASAQVREGAAPAAAPATGTAAAKDYTTSTVYTRLMAFDKNKDGKLTKEELTDERLMRLFERADGNADGEVTKEELTTLAAKLETETAQGGGGRGGPGGGGPGGGGAGAGGPGGRGGPGGGGPGGGGPGGRGPGGPPQPGVILTSFTQDALNLTADQKKKLDELQADVDAKLSKILTKEQQDQLKQMRERGPGGRGGPGGGGPGGPGGGGPGGGGPGGPGGAPPLQ